MFNSKGGGVQIQLCLVTLSLGTTLCLSPLAGTALRVAAVAIKEPRLLLSNSPELQYLYFRPLERQSRLESCSSTELLIFI